MSVEQLKNALKRSLLVTLVFAVGIACVTYSGLFAIIPSLGGVVGAALNGLIVATIYAAISIFYNLHQFVVSTLPAQVPAIVNTPSIPDVNAASSPAIVSREFSSEVLTAAPAFDAESDREGEVLVQDLASLERKRLDLADASFGENSVEFFDNSTSTELDITVMEQEIEHLRHALAEASERNAALNIELEKWSVYPVLPKKKPKKGGGASSSLVSEKMALEERIVTVTQTYMSLQDAYAELELKLKNTLSTNAALTQSLTQNECTMSDLRAAKSSVDIELARSQAEYAAQLRKMRGTIDHQESAIRSIGEERLKHKKEVEELQRLLREAHDYISDTISELKVANGQLSQLKSELDLTKKTLSETEQALEDATSAQATSLSSPVLAKSASKRSKKGKESVKSKKISEDPEDKMLDIEVLKSTISKLELEKKELEDRVGVLEKQLEDPITLVSQNIRAAKGLPGDAETSLSEKSKATPTLWQERFGALLSLVENEWGNGENKSQDISSSVLKWARPLLGDPATDVDWTAVIDSFMKRFSSMSAKDLKNEGYKALSSEITVIVLALQGQLEVYRNAIEKKRELAPLIDLNLKSVLSRAIPLTAPKSLTKSTSTEDIESAQEYIAAIPPSSPTISFNLDAEVSDKELMKAMMDRVDFASKQEINRIHALIITADKEWDTLKQQYTLVATENEMLRRTFHALEHVKDIDRVLKTFLIDLTTLATGLRNSSLENIQLTSDLENTKFENARLRGLVEVLTKKANEALQVFSTQKNLIDDYAVENKVLKEEKRACMADLASQMDLADKITAELIALEAVLASLEGAFSNTNNLLDNPTNLLPEKERAAAEPALLEPGLPECKPLLLSRSQSMLALSTPNKPRSTSPIHQRRNSLSAVTNTMKM